MNLNGFIKFIQGSFLQKFGGGTGFYTADREVVLPAEDADLTLVGVAADGTDGQVLTTDGAGVYGWADMPAYETGTFSPSLSFTGGSVTMLLQNGSYTILGNRIFVDIEVSSSAVSSPGFGQVFIDTGLSNCVGTNASGSVGKSNALAGDHPITARIDTGSNQISLWYLPTSSGAIANLNGNDLHTGSNDNYINISMNWRIS